MPSSQPPLPLAVGSPRFADPELARAEQAEGPLASWSRIVGLPEVEALRAAASARGHFALAAGSGDRALLAVDRFATRSLCWRFDEGRLSWSARADELAPRRPRLDLQALYDYLYFHAIPSPRTVFEGVHRLPPGHLARAEAGRLDVKPFWTPRFDEKRSASFAALRDEFRRLLADAVRRGLDGSKPACFLSGGTDSSTVAGMIGEVTGKPAATYSIGFDAQGYDEMEFARIAARRFGCDHHEYYVTPDDLVRGIPLMAAYLDQPFGNSSALPAYCCALRAREDGVTRLLAGDGGDELFGGNTRYAKQRVFDAYQALPAGLRSGLLEPMSRAGGGLDRLPLLRKGASYVRQARVAMPDRYQSYNLLDRLGVGEVLTPGFLARVDREDPLRQQRAVWQQSEGASFVNRMLAFDWRYTLAENDLPKVRASTELAGVEVAYPLLDQELVDFSTSLVTSYKLKGLKLRWFFKEALRGFLPDEIITKKKHGFGLPFGVWAVSHDGLRELASDSLRGLAERGLVRRAFLDELLAHHLPEHPGYYGEMVWILMMLEQWLRAHAPDWRFEG
ncbi:MAG: asparagine synthase [Burkholderiales bacterium]|nr:asparagine synthase [Burkholderiales bacterium]